MSCNRFVDALTRHAAGDDLEPAVAEHLGGCARCQGELDAARDALSLVDATLLNALTAEPSPQLAARDRSLTVSAPAAPRSPWRQWWMPASALAAAAAALLIWGAARQPATPDVRQAEERRPAAPAPLATGETTRSEVSESSKAGSSQSSKLARSEPMKSAESKSAKSADVFESAKSEVERRVRAESAEVLVPSADRAALHLLLASVRAGRVQDSVIEAAATDTQLVAVATALTIAPLTIDPVVVSAPLAPEPPPPRDAAQPRDAAP